MRMTGDAAEMAERIGLTARRVRQLEEIGVLVRNAAEVFDLDWNSRRYRIFAERDCDAAAHEIERAGRDVDAAFSALRACSADKRRKMAAEVGPLVGRLDAALRLVPALAQPTLRPLIERAVVADSGRVLAEFAALVGLKIADNGK